MKKTWSLQSFDFFIDNLLGQRGYDFLRRWSLYIGSAALMVLVSFCISYFLINRSAASVLQMRVDMQFVARALSRLDQDCGLVKVRAGLHDLQPLVQRSYPAEQLEPMIQLQNTANWRGPYIRYVPVLQGKPYQLFANPSGIFIVPGHGVALPNGLVMDRDVVLNQSTDILALIAAGGDLMSNTAPLIEQVQFSQPSMVKDQEQLDALSSSLGEFATTMSLACR